MPLRPGPPVAVAVAAAVALALAPAPGPAGAAAPAPPPPAPACPAVAAGTLTVALDAGFVRGLNRAGFVVSGTYPATLARRTLRLPVAPGGSLAAGERIAARGSLFLHAGSHLVSLGGFALRDRVAGGELLARVNDRPVVLARLPFVPCTRPALRGARLRLAPGAARALRRALDRPGPAAGAPLGRLTLRTRIASGRLADFRA